MARAREVARPRRLSDECRAGGVGAALVTGEGNVHVGVCIDAASGIGFCAEHAAIAHMITCGESRIAKIVAVSSDGKLMPPCGRCRELIYEVDRRNLDTQVLLEGDRTVLLRDLLPERWQELWQ